MTYSQIIAPCDIQRSDGYFADPQCIGPDAFYVFIHLALILQEQPTRLLEDLQCMKATFCYKSSDYYIQVSWENFCKIYFLL